mmetsp:Transcript_3721/g.6161  ORF Transcript_3721/g.6161 Transcript_3721/m.6161 type:complete len:123 (-) Transcript_3721:1290-1658(-)
MKKEGCLEYGLDYPGEATAAKESSAGNTVVAVERTEAEDGETGGGVLVKDLDGRARRCLKKGETMERMRTTRVLHRVWTMDQLGRYMPDLLVDWEARATSGTSIGKGSRLRHEHGGSWHKHF